MCICTERSTRHSSGIGETGRTSENPDGIGGTRNNNEKSGKVQQINEIKYPHRFQRFIAGLCHMLSLVLLVRPMHGVTGLRMPSFV